MCFAHLQKIALMIGKDLSHLLFDLLPSGFKADVVMRRFNILSM